MEAVKGNTMFTQCGWRLRKRSGDYIERVREGELLRGGVFFGNFWLSVTFCEKKILNCFFLLVQNPQCFQLLVELAIVLLVARLSNRL